MKSLFSVSFPLASVRVCAVYFLQAIFGFLAMMLMAIIRPAAAKLAVGRQELESQERHAALEERLGRIERKVRGSVTRFQ